MKRLGPELKMPDLKAPPFLSDLYWDLRDRRLLPLVALVVVAIAAAPFLLGGGSEEEAPAPVAAGGAAASAAEAARAGASSLTVVEAKPGLRDYRKRLAGREPADPFKQRFTAPQVSGAQLNAQTTTTSTDSSSETTSTTTVESSDGGSAPSGSPSGGDSGKPHLTLFAFAIDVQISKSETKQDGSTKMGEPATKHRVLPTTPLPGEKAPVVTYMGVNAKNGAKALLMVSNNVNSIFGDAHCLSGTDTCQLLEVEPGFPETFVYGDNDVRYKIKVLKIEPVVTGRL